MLMNIASTSQKFSNGIPFPVLSEEDQKIGKFIAEDLVEDGATLQMGIGAIPDAVSI